MSSENDPFELVRAEELLLVYVAFWGEDNLTVLSVEEEFDAPLINPDTGAASKTFRLGGKMDGIVRDEAGDEWVLEHKSSSMDISDGSMWWKQISLSSQASTYLVGARHLGHNPKGVLYDVIAKPKQTQKLATPVEDREYIKERSKTCPECKKKKQATPAPHDVDGLFCKDGRIVTEPGGRLHANQREEDETLDEYRLRIRAVLSEEPERYFVRGPIVKLEEEEKEAAFDVHQEMKRILDGRRTKRFPRNPDSCVRYGQICTFWGVCAGEASLEDQTRYRITVNRHDELSKSHTSLPLLTNSEISTARACARMHYYRYELGYRAVKATDAQRFGNLLHIGLEFYYKARKENVSLVEQLQAGLDAMREVAGCSW